LELLGLELLKETGIALSISHVRTLLLEMGCRRGRPRPALRIPVRGRRRILENIARLVKRASPKQEVFYMDEADIDLNPRIGLAYIKRGHQPLVFTPGKNRKRYVAGALNARTGSLVNSYSEKKNSGLFISLLERLQSVYRRAETLHLILDNYIIHKSRQTLSWLGRIGHRVVLHFLPPYSPESNVIERLWKQMHDHVTRNHRHATMESLMVAVAQFLDDVQPFPGTKVSTLPLVA
jgi:transposase